MKTVFSDLRRGPGAVLVGAGLLAALVSSPAAAAKPPNAMVQARVEDRLLEGKPLSWSDRNVILLARDGQIVEFDPNKVRDFRKSSPRFYSYSTGEMRGKLYEEFGRAFEITGTGHYLVVHPRGQKDVWADRFEKLYRSFVHYFQVRGFQIRDPKFPLVAVVFRRQQDYYDYAASTGSKLPAGTLGHYSHESNRVFLFDVTYGRGSADWARNAETIIHEAAHQTAFNTGIHTRYGGAPSWVVEGLATMFETRGVWDSGSYHSAKDRINVGQLVEFKRYVASKHKEGDLTELIASDRIFRRDFAAAYASAWALSHYLCETRPRKFAKYLAVTAARPAFQVCTAEERLQDFQSVFGNNLKMLEVQFHRYMQSVKF